MKKLYFLIALLATLLAACGGTPQTTEASLPAPEFNLPNSLGGNVSLSDYEGKNVLLFFHMAVG